MVKMKHGQTKRGKWTPEYQAWKNMRARCQNPNDPNYKNYGGRGIKVCERWQDFRNFFADVGKRPGPGYSIDRADNNGNYELSNVQWATSKEQASNRRPRSFGSRIQHYFYAANKRAEYFRSNNQHDVAEMFNLNQGAISKCLRGVRHSHKGWTFQWA